MDEIDLRGEISVDAEWMAYLAGFRYLRCLNIANCQRINSSALWLIVGMSETLMCFSRKLYLTLNSSALDFRDVFVVEFFYFLLHFAVS